MKNIDLNHSNMLNSSSHDLKKSTKEGFNKTSIQE